MRCTRLAGNTGRKKSPSRHHRTTCRAISSQLRHVSSIGKKNLLSSNTSSICPDNVVNFSPLTAEIHSGVWGTPANFNWFRVLADLGGVMSKWLQGHLTILEQWQNASATQNVKQKDISNAALESDHTRESDASNYVTDCVMSEMQSKTRPVIQTGLLTT